MKQPNESWDDYANRLASRIEDMEIEYVSQRVCYWLRELTGPKPWAEPMVYAQPHEILPGEMGAYRGVRVVELGW